MNYIIKHANTDWTLVEFPLTIEDLFALTKENEDQFIAFNEPGDIVFIYAGYLKSCIEILYKRKVVLCQSRVHH